MTYPCKVTYVLSGITKRTDLLDMESNTEESAINAIRDNFYGVWGFDPDAIEIVKIVSGHYEEKLFPATDIRAKLFPGMTRKVFVEG